MFIGGEDMHYDKVIRILRRNSGKTRNEVSASIGYTVDSIKKWESGAMSMSLSSIETLADYYKVPYSLLIYDQDNLEFSNKSISGLGIMFEVWSLKLHDLYKTIKIRQQNSEDYDYLITEYLKAHNNIVQIRRRMYKLIREDMKNFDKEVEWFNLSRTDHNY
jgi:transcriptional regulator with XRE-family HTH domain